MPAYSFTAPIITEEQVQEERLSLSKEEERHVKLDLYGKIDDDTTNDHDCVNSIVRDQLQRQQEDKLSERIPLALDKMNHEMANLLQKDSMAYYEACKRVPELVNRESNPTLFLEFVEYDPVAAAKKLASYWNLRRGLFGPDSAFLPMTLRGAMANDTAAIVKLGYMQILPTDDQGRSILFVDHVRLVKPLVSREQYARLFFYHAQVLASKPKATERIYVTLTNAKGFDVYANFDRVLLKNMLKITPAFPIRRAAFHVYCGSGKSVLGIILPVFKFLAGKEFRLRFAVHAGSDKDILSELESFGIRGDHLVSYLNGTYKINQSTFLSWLEQQDKHEEEYNNHNHVALQLTLSNAEPVSILQQTTVA